MKRICEGMRIRVNPIPGLENPIEGNGIRDNQTRTFIVEEIREEDETILLHELLEGGVNRNGGPIGATIRVTLQDLLQAYMNTPKWVRRITKTRRPRTKRPGKKKKETDTSAEAGKK